MVGSAFRYVPVFPGLHPINRTHGVRRFVARVGDVYFIGGEEVDALHDGISLTRLSRFGSEHEAHNSSVNGCVERERIGRGVVRDSEFFNFVVFQGQKQALVPRFKDVKCQAFSRQGQQAQWKQWDGSKG